MSCKARTKSAQVRACTREEREEEEASPQLIRERRELKTLLAKFRRAHPKLLHEARGLTVDYNEVW